MIPTWAIYLFIFTAGASVGWITTHAIVGYLYEKLLLTSYVRKDQETEP